MKNRWLGCVAIVGLLLGGSQAEAGYTLVNPGSNNPTGGEDNLIPFVNSGKPVIMDSIYGPGNYLRIDDSLDNFWTNPDGNAAAVAIFAGNSQTLWYNGSTTVKLFSVPSSNGYLGGIPSAGLPPGPPGPEWFTWLLDTSPPPDSPAGPEWSSNAAVNSDGDHMVSFYITGGNAAGHYVIAWEDLALNVSDKDYQDLVVEVVNAYPDGLEQGPVIPEPASVVIWGVLGAGAAAGLAVRRRRIAVRTPWSEENRQAVFEVIGQGRP